MKRVARAAFLAVLLATRVASADDDARLRELERRFDEGEAAARLYWAGWSTAFAVASSAQLSFAIDTDDTRLRTAAFVGATTAAIGLVTTLPLPPRAMIAAPHLRAMPEATEDDRRRKLAYAEAELSRARDEEALATSLVAHVGGVVVNGVAGALLWVKWGERLEGAATFLVGTAVSEAKIATTPRLGRDAPRVSLSIAPGGLGIAGVF